MTPEMLAALESLAALAQDGLMQGGLVFARVGPVFALVPAFGERVIPARIRLAAALAMTAVVAPAVSLPGALGADAALMTRALTVMQETLVGVMLGLGLRMMVMTLQIAATIAAQATSLAQAFGGAGVDPQPAMAQVLVMAALALAVITGFAERLAQMLVLSYDLLPAGVWPEPASLAEWGTARTAHLFALAFSLAAPFVIAAALYNLALGAINKAMPALMVAFIGAPALTLGGLALFALAAPLMLGPWLAAFHGVLADPVSPR